MSERKNVLLRLDPAVHDALARWAGDELRSTNAQIEFLLRRALADAGRLPGAYGTDAPPRAATLAEAATPGWSPRVRYGIAPASWRPCRPACLTEANPTPDARLSGAFWPSPCRDGRRTLRSKHQPLANGAPSRGRCASTAARDPGGTSPDVHDVLPRSS